MLDANFFALRSKSVCAIGNRDFDDIGRHDEGEDKPVRTRKSKGIDRANRLPRYTRP
jgi:hypothetical protein